MKIPKKVLIGPYEYEIKTGADWVRWAEEREADGTLLDGYISPRNQRIVIDTDTAHPNNARYALAHEIIHGLLDVTGDAQTWERAHGGEEYEEQFVARFSAALLAVLRLNPAVVDYLVAS